MRSTTSQSSRAFLTDAAQLVALTAFAVGQPLLDLLRRFPEFLVVHGVEPLDLALLVPALFVVVPAALMGVEILVDRFSRRARARAHDAAVGLLAALVLLPPLHRGLPLPGMVSVTVAAGGGLVVAVMARRTAIVGQFLTGTVLAAPVFCGVFLLDPDVRGIFAAPPEPISVPGRATDRSVAVVVFDALPTSSLLDENGRIDRRRYPSFARLADDAIWFPHATTAGSHTLVAVPAILTGLYPQPGRHPTLAHHPRNLFTLLRASHDLIVSEPITRLCPDELTRRPGSASRLLRLLSDLRWVYLQFLLPADFTASLPAVDRNWSDFDPDLDPPRAAEHLSRRVREFQEFLARIRPTDRPTLYFTHLVLPHSPYQHFPSGNIYSLTGHEPSGQAIQRGDDEMAAVHSYQRHLLQLEFADRLLGQVLTRLQETGNYENTAVVVVADHGVSFRPGAHGRKVVEQTAADILLVPFLMKLPGGGREGVTDERGVETIDALPSIADALGITLPWEVDGRSVLREGAAGRDTHRCVTSHGPWTGTLEDLMSFHTETLDRKLSWFGSGARPGGLFRAGPHPDLVGRVVADLQVGRPEPRLSLASSRHPVVEASGSFVPAEVVGYLELGRGARRPAPLAVAVDGTLQTVTASYTPWHRKGIAPWSALLPESSLGPGRHTIEVFRVVEGDGEIVLRPSARDEGLPSFLDMVLGRWRVPGVTEEGFRHARPEKGADFRWTTGHARLVIPVEGGRPRRVRIVLADTGPEGTPLRLRANGGLLFEGDLAPGRWSRSFDLGSTVMDTTLTLEIVSDTFARQGGALTSILRGVAVEGIWLSP